MKYLKAIILLVLILSCSSQDSNDHQKEESIIGKWQLIEVLEGYPTQSEIIENGYVYTFKTDGSFTTNKFVLAECESGNYSVTETT